MVDIISLLLFSPSCSINAIGNVVLFWTIFCQRVLRFVLTVAADSDLKWFGLGLFGTWSRESKSKNLIQNSAFFHQTPSCSVKKSEILFRCDCQSYEFAFIWSKENKESYWKFSTSLFRSEISFSIGSMFSWWYILGLSFYLVTKNAVSNYMAWMIRACGFCYTFYYIENSFFSFTFNWFPIYNSKLEWYM